MAEKKSKSSASKPSAKKQETDKAKALATSLAEIEKKHGQGSVMRLGDQSKIDIDAISTGSISLDHALGIGGIPKGRITEIYGHESSGKTTLALHVVAQAQKAGDVAFIDAEHALDPTYASAIGVDIDNLLISQPNSGEQALEIAEALVRSGALELVVVDSVAALVPKAELDGDMGDSKMGLHARLMSQAMRKLAGYISRHNTAVIFINQLREMIGKTSPGGKTMETTTGGRALKFYSSVRIDVRSFNKVTISGDIPIGGEVLVKVVKNKVAPPFKECKFDVIYGEGISHENELIDLGEKLGLVKKSGTWFSYGDIRLGQGKEQSRQFLKTHPEAAEKLMAEIMPRRDELVMKNAKSGKYGKGTASKVKVEEQEPEDESVRGDENIAAGDQYDGDADDTYIDDPGGDLGDD